MNKNLKPDINNLIKSIQDNLKPNIDDLKPNIDDFIKSNQDNLKKMINTNNFEHYYIMIKDLVFDNLILIIVFYLIILPFLFKKEGSIRKFNYWMILAIVGLFLVNYFSKIFFRTFFKLGNTLRANTCLNATNHIIFNKTIKPIESFTKYLNKPFHEFYINTSHNTYVPCSQNVDISSTEAIKRAIGMGARVIELDCYARKNTGTSNEDLEPVVSHGIEKKTGDIFTLSPITFEECIDTIVTFGTLTSDPLFINLELNTNKLLHTQKRMKEIIIEKLGNKLLSYEYKISNKQNRKSFINEPIKNLLNKVIIFTGNGYTDELSDIIDGVFNLDNMTNDDHLNELVIKNENKPGIIQRIYPSGNVSGHLSLNYDPLIFWKNKCQMIALNFQVVDENLMKNIAMFKNSSFVHFSQFNK